MITVTLHIRINQAKRTSYSYFILNTIWNSKSICIIIRSKYKIVIFSYRKIAVNRKSSGLDCRSSCYLTSSPGSKIKLMSNFKCIIIQLPVCSGYFQIIIIICIAKVSYGSTASCCMVSITAFLVSSSAPYRCIPAAKSFTGIPGNILCPAFSEETAPR